MNTSIQHPEPKGIVQPSGDSSQREGTLFAGRKPPGRFTFAALLAGLLLLLFSAPAARAQLPGTPPGCAGSGLGIALSIPSGDSHVGCTICYSVTVYNGGVGPLTYCDASNIVAFVVTPDLVTHPITLSRTYLTSGQWDFYSNAVCYVIRTNDLLFGDVVRATAQDIAIILQNDHPSASTNEQGVNTEVSIPGLKILAQCVPSVGENGAITYTGTVTNTGNNTLYNVTVTSSVTGLVTNYASIAVTNFVSFSGFWVPTNSCSPSTNTLSATGSDRFTNCAPPTPIFSSTNIVCQNILTPGIKVTKTCSVDQVPPGFSLSFSGSVSNSGNVTLTNIVVVNNQPVPNTTVFTLPSLAQGAVATFTGSYPAPTNCSVTDTLTARASSFCGVAVTNTDTKTCTILTTPQIAVTAVCPLTPVVPGGTLTYSVTVSNAGSFTLTNVVVFSDRPVPNTVILTRASLARGVSTNFTAGSYTVPANACSVTTTFSGTGSDPCTLSAVTNAVSTTCPVTTAPSIGVTLACPVAPANAGGPITYTGTVTNSGNVALINVYVVNNQPSNNTPVIGPLTLAPHASSNFNATFTAPTNACSVSSTVTVTGSDNCYPQTPLVTSTASAGPCPLNTTPLLAITQNCPVTYQVTPGQPLVYSVTVSNAGNITLTNVVVLNNLSGTTPILTNATLDPGAVTNFTGSYIAPTNCSTTSTSTATGRSICGVAVTNSASSTCSIQTAPAIVVTAACPLTPVVPGGSLTYSGTVSNAGNITLTNVVVVSDRPSPNTVLIVASLAPHVSTNFTAGSYTVPANACSVTTTFSGTGTDCTPRAVTNTVSPTCTVFTTPGIGVTLACPIVPVAAGGLITYTGTVTNTGNVILTNVTVVDNQASPSTVLFVPSLAPHASSNFNASFITPTNACSVSSTVTVTGRDNCTAAPVTNTASAGPCPLITTPLLVVTQNCPPTALPKPGEQLYYSGTVSNAGNITITNVVVLNNLSGATSVTNATLAPGAVTNFNGNYLVPTNCSTTSTSTATGRSICGVGVTNSASATCPIQTSPAIVVTAVCPQTPAVPGGLLTYSGTVSNAGDITLTNVVVVSDRPNPNSPVIGPLTLAPHAFANFTAGSYNVPSNACTVTTTFSGTGTDCTPRAVTNTVSPTCTVFTTPGIGVTLACPIVPVAAGGLITYTGTITNTGNVILTNVTVVDNQASPSTVLFVPSLAPHASSNFNASFITPTNACSVSSTVTATGRDNCTAAPVTNTASAGPCPLITTPGIKVTKSCPAQSVSPGQTLTFSGSVSNTGNVTLNNIVVVNNQPSNNTPVITVASLAPGAGTTFTGSYVAPTNCSVTDTLTAIGRSICGVAVTNTDTKTCAILTTPAIVVTTACPTNPVGQGGLLTFSGTVSNAGNITLTNIVVVNNWPYYSNVIFTAVSLAPGATTNFTGSYLVPLNCCQAWIWVVARGQGCDGFTVTDTDSRTCTVFTSPQIVLTKVCVPTMRRGHPVLLRPGDLLTYSGTVSNAGNITLINVTVVDNQPAPGYPVLNIDFLAPGEVQTYTGSYTVPADFCGEDTVTATGLDACSYALVTNSVTATCPMAPYSPRIGVTKRCPERPTRHGGTLTFSGTVSNLGNVTLVNVFVVDNQPSNNTPVIGPITLAPGAFTNFTGSYTAPLVCCETIDTLTARAQDRCSGSNVTATATAICPMLYTPGIALVQVCPPNLLPGSSYVVSGFVTNTGDAILTNVVVFSSQVCRDREDGLIDGQLLPLSLLGPIDLAPGQSEPYTGCLTVPYNTCEVTINVTGQETCKSTWITNTTTCPIATTALLALTQNCPVNAAVRPGVPLTYSGTVSNAGNITITNVVVVNNLSGATSVTNATLAPGAVTNFTGSYVAPTNCSTTSTSTATGWSICGVAVTNTVNSTCPIITTPGITIRENCPPGPVTNGSSVDFGGVVCNSGDIPLTNIFVFSSQQNNTLVLGPAPGPLLGPIPLGPGECAPFFGSYIATGGSNPTTNCIVVTNSSESIYTNVDIVITTNYPGAVTTNNVTPTFGTIDPVTGILTDRFNVVSNLHGLMFADQQENWGPTLFYTTRHPASGPDQFDTISTIPPSVGAVTDRFPLSATNYDALTFAAPDVGHGEINFYYIRHDAPSLSIFGQIISQGASSSADFAPVLPGTGYNALAFAAPNLGTYGANLFHFIRTDNAGVATYGTIYTSGAMVVTDRYPVGTNANFDSLVFVPTPGVIWGANIFAYLRHDTNGSIIGTIDPVTHVVTDRVILGTNFLSALTFTPTAVGYGPSLFYYLRPERTILTTNTVTTYETNTVTTYRTNTVTTYTTNCVVSFTPANTVTATGMDICQSRTVTAAANCLGPIVLTDLIIGTPKVNADGFFSLSFPSEVGKSYMVQYKDTLLDPTWTDLVPPGSEPGTGGLLTINDPSPAALHPTRFYRVMSMP